MCGIVGYTGSMDVTPILLKGLHHLEYRGYDSAGIAVDTGNGIALRKEKGELKNLDALVEKEPVHGHIGIGHTRWATHGEPSRVNAHPHVDANGKFAIVHNGIIENYLRLKNHLLEQGVKFVSETDTEVAVQLLSYNYEKCHDVMDAIYETLHMLEGSYAFAIMCVDEPDTLYCMRKNSPLVIGKCEHGTLLASDIPAMLEYTRDVYFLDNGDVARLRPDSIEFFNEFRAPFEKESTHIEWDVEAAEKGGFEHFMIKEIHEEPTVLANTLSRYIDVEHYAIREDALGISDEQARAIRKVGIVACGTAYHAGLIAKNLFEAMWRVPTEVSLASEFIYQDPIIDPDDFYIIISQSGETADTKTAMHIVQDHGAKALAICNVVGSSIAREADHVLYTLAGPEIAVASTKAYSTQLMMIYVLLLAIGKKRGAIEEADFRHMIDELAAVPAKIETILADKTKIQQFASSVAGGSNAFFLGRGLDYALAMEASLKLKEISYVHAEAYAAGELKHGTIALIEDGVLVVALATQDHLTAKMASNVKEVNVRKANILSLVNGDNPQIEAESHHVWHMPESDCRVMPIICITALQLFAYYVSLQRGCNVDKPRNLAKSVTVE